jgi:hypothetical protein
LKSKSVLSILKLILQGNLFLESSHKLALVTNSHWRVSSGGASAGSGIKAGTRGSESAGGRTSGSAETSTEVGARGSKGGTGTFSSERRSSGSSKRRGWSGLGLLKSRGVAGRSGKRAGNSWSQTLSELVEHDSVVAISVKSSNDSNDFGIGSNETIESQEGLNVSMI